MQKLLRIVIESGEEEEEEERREGELDGRNETGRCWFRLAEAAQIGANRFISCNQRRPYVSLSLFSP